jgi:phosphoglycolate phosphatase-like HAD superfamily hydrolase
MTRMLKIERLLMSSARLTALFAIVDVTSAATWAQSKTITITLTGQSMIRSDIRATAPAAVPVIQRLLTGDVVFANFECAIAEKGETVHEDRGFLAPPEALDALTEAGFNLLSLTNNHSFDLKVTGIQNTLREADRRFLSLRKSRRPILT